MKRLNLFHFAVIYVTAICSITSIPRYLILKGNSPHSLDLVLYLHIPEHTRSLSGGLLGHKIMP